MKLYQELQLLNLDTFPSSSHIKNSIETRSKNPNYNYKITQGTTRASSLIVIITDIKRANKKYGIVRNSLLSQRGFSMDDCVSVFMCVFMYVLSVLSEYSVATSALCPDEERLSEPPLLF